MGLLKPGNSYFPTSKMLVLKLMIGFVFLKVRTRNTILDYPDVQGKILTRHKDRKEFATPLEVAIKKNNFGFIGEFYVLVARFFIFEAVINNCIEKMLQIL